MEMKFLSLFYTSSCQTQDEPRNNDDYRRTTIGGRWASYTTAALRKETGVLRTRGAFSGGDDACRREKSVPEL